MKKLVFYSEESLFCGNAKCGIAEVVDSLANSLSMQYEVIIICKQGNLDIAKALSTIVTLEEGVKYAKFLQVNYFIIDETKWPEKSYEVINKLRPDIIHNFFDPELILKLDFKCQTIFTFDDVNILDKYKESLEEYDFVTTFSNGYYEYIMTHNKKAADILKNLNFKKITIGISTEAFTPKKGLLIPMAYNENEQFGKEKSKQRLCEKFGISTNKIIYLLICRLVKEKGIELILKDIEKIKSSNGHLIVIGKGKSEYEEFFQKLSKNNEITFINSSFSPAQIIPIMSGSDFYLQPSLQESGGIMPMIASQYGTIPIVTLNGGLADNFNMDNAIIVNDNNLEQAITEATDIYNNKHSLHSKRRVCMTQDFSWKTRKEDFINLYENKEEK